MNDEGALDEPADVGGPLTDPELKIAAVHRMRNPARPVPTLAVVVFVPYRRRRLWRRLLARARGTRR